VNNHVHVTTTFLEIVGNPRVDAIPVPQSANVAVASDISVSDYRRLYDEVGAPWLWYERSNISDSEVKNLIQNPEVSILTLRLKTKVVGFSELRLQETPSGSRDTQILYFGLRPAYIGLGLGRFFLHSTVRFAFRANIERLWVHTCSLDHARALRTYQKAGFTIFGQESGWVSLPQDARMRQRLSQKAMP